MKAIFIEYLIVVAVSIPFGAVYASLLAFGYDSAWISGSLLAAAMATSIYLAWRRRFGRL